MARAGQELRGPNDYVLRLITTGAESDGELLEMEASYGEGAMIPPEHFHPSQAERFEVLDGAVLTVIDGVERRYEAGETFEVPAETPHQMTGDGPARVNWQVRPALRTSEFFEVLLGGNPDGIDILEEFSAEIRFPDAG